MVLSAVELVALAKCVKDKDASEARSQIPDGSAQNVDFRVHVVGCVTRAGGTAEVVARVEATTRPPDLLRFEVCCAALRELGIGEKRLESALRAVAGRPNDEELTARLRSIFERVAVDFAESVPAREIVTPAKAGNVSVAVTLSKV